MRTCPECKVKFTPAVSWQKYCSRAHGMNVYNRKSYRKRELAKNMKDIGYVRHRAASMINHEIKMGRMVRKPCEICKTTERVEGHHEDYSRPLEVRWLCGFHHKKRHEEIRLGKSKK